jgi:glutaconyl-CoA decarboxylase
MKKYRVKVNGKLYEVELEAVEENNQKIEVAPKEVTPSSNGTTSELLAPIGGKVLAINVKVNDHIKKGDTVCIIEAMKLENEVKANRDGVVKEIKITTGTTVANKQVIMIIG